MGACASSNKGKTSPPQPQNTQNPPINKPVKKLTPEEAEKKRQQLRKNLEQGHAQPPPIHIPKIEPVGILS